MKGLNLTCEMCIFSNSTTAGLEPTQAEPNGFRVRLLNHSDTLPTNGKVVAVVVFRRLNRTLRVGSLVRMNLDREQRRIAKYILGAGGARN
jgi:hypothetical protein